MFLQIKFISNMFEYSKIILKKVSFDPILFKKELEKALKNISQEDLASFEDWCIINFGKRYSHILEEVFENQLLMLNVS